MNKSRSGLFGYLLFLTGIFLLLEISFFMQRSGFYLADFKMVADHLVIPHTILGGVIFFILAQLLVHFTFTVIVWAEARLIGVVLRCSWQRTETIGFGLWCITIATVLLANQHFFANSHFADLIHVFIHPQVATILLIFFGGACAAALVTAVVGLVTLLVTTLPIFSRMIFGVIFLSATAGVVVHQQHPVDAATAERPNIILIGVDSLRPDYLGFMGADNITPHIDEFLKQATVFAQAMTPQARTFPAWMSILTGQYPRNIGARYDLIPKSSLHVKDSLLPKILHDRGYETVYATDETRFSNIDEFYGFDQTVTPPVGFNDFLLGTLNDFPLSNLIVNTSVGKWLFPYSYANRPVYITYDPDSFLKLMQPVLEKSRDKPLFFTVHFCLPHFPYFWSSYSYNETIRAVPHYFNAVRRADQQVADFLALLEQNGLLKHSIVVLLSDHGEALELHGDRITDRDLFIAGGDNKKKIVPHFYPRSFDTETINQSAGHGTDVLSITQYHTVMAFRLYGMQPAQPQVVPDIVSLMDIKPTILGLLDIPITHTDGNSLTTYILAGQKPPVVTSKDLFLESDFSPESVRTAHPETKKVLFEGIDFFTIDPVTTTLTIKESMGDLIVSSKQYADLYAPWILALYPQPDGQMMPILVNLETGSWTNDLRTSFAMHSPAKQMLSSLQKQYGSELSKIKNVSQKTT